MSVGAVTALSAPRSHWALFRTSWWLVVVCIGLVVSACGPTHKANSGGSNKASSTVDSSYVSPNQPIQFVAAKVGWRLGGTQMSAPESASGNSPQPYAAPRLYGSLLTTSDGGASWTTVDNSAQGFWGIDFVGDSDGWVVGASGLLATTDGGSTWTSLPESGPGIRVVDFTSANDGWALTATGQLEDSTDGGGTWTELATPSSQIAAACSASATSGWIVGQSGSVWATSNAGQAWTSDYVPSFATSNTAIQSAQLICSGPSAWVGYNLGPAGVNSESYLVVRTENGGSTWTSVAGNPAGSLGPAPSGAPSFGESLGPMALVNANTAMVLGVCQTCVGSASPVATLWTTTNGGATFTSQGDSSASTLFPVGISLDNQNPVQGQWVMAVPAIPAPGTDVVAILAGTTLSGPLAAVFSGDS